MLKVVPKAPFEDVINIGEVSSLGNRIIVCEKDKDKACQRILIEVPNGNFGWCNFYQGRATIADRTEYSSLEIALQERIDKGYSVYVLNNKKELKEFIKHR